MRRLAAAWKAFWTILTSAEAGEQWRRMLPDQTGEKAAEQDTESAAAARGTDQRHADAVYTLVLLQRGGRLIDFLQEDIEPYSDAQVGAAVRQIHAGCGKVLNDIFAVEPIESRKEGTAVIVPADFDPRSVRLTGQPEGDPPYHGTVTHGGWRATKTDLPERHQDLDPMVVCPAEIEVPGSAS